MLDYSSHKKLNLLALLLCSLLFTSSFSQSSKIDSLSNLLKADKEDTLKTRHLYLLSGAYIYSDELDKALNFGEQGLSLANKINDQKRITSFNRLIGVVYERKHNYPEAKKYYLTAIKEREKLPTKNNHEESYSNLATIYYEEGNYPDALKYYLKAIKDNEETKKWNQVASAYNNIGSVYVRQNNYPEALNNYNASLTIGEKIKDKNTIANGNLNIGSILGQLGKYEEALTKLKLSLQQFHELEDDFSMAYSYEEIGGIYSLQGKKKEALESFLASLKIKETIGDEYELPSILNNIGSFYLKEKKIKEAKSYLTKAEEISKKINIKEDLRTTYENLYQLDSTIGNYNDAFKHYRFYIAYRDSLINQENQKKIIQIEMQNAFDKKEAATKFENTKIIERLETDNKLHAQQRIFFIVSIIIILILLFFAKRAYDNKKKIATFMASENHRKEVLLEEVHHRINNNLQIISGLLSLQANTAKDDKLKEYLKQSQNRIQSLSVLHNLLYQNDSPLKINMNQYLNRVLDYHVDVINNLGKNINLIIEAPDFEFSTKLAVPIALIVNELVTNSIKYAFSDSNKGQIKISLSKLENEKKDWKLIVCDNGKGLPEESNFRKDSLGLRLVDIMTKQLKGTFSKSNSNGALFEITFKLEA